MKARRNQAKIRRLAKSLAASASALAGNGAIISMAVMPALAAASAAEKRNLKASFNLAASAAAA
jgi:hypothetical protein